MKCKPGDAVVVVGPNVSADTTTIGWYGTVLRWVEFYEFLPEFSAHSYASGPGWLVRLSRPIPSSRHGVDLAIYPDSSLMPIRPGAEDEDTSEGQNAREGMVAHG